MKNNITNPLGHFRRPDTQSAHADYNGHLAAIIESSDDAIISKDLDGTIQSWNKSCEKMFGFSEEQAVGQNISIIIPAEYLSEEKKIVQRICNNESIEHYKTVRNNKNGEHISVSLTVSPIKNHEGTVIGVSKIIRDITFQNKSDKELIDANKELFSQNEEKEKRAAELVVANTELAYQNDEKEKRASELIVANKELLFQNEEKEKRAAELVIANTELAYQNEEKEKRASELIIANKELLFQNEEKGKRAAELAIANTELEYQNEEKEKRASELIVANKELLFQNEEKEKRAAELVIANNELAFQNEEKEKRADELVIANKELAFQNEEKEKRATELTVANKALESFSYSVSHDLRAPLRHISGFVDLLTNRFHDTVGEKERHYLNNISESAHQMGALIDDLLQFSRTGRQEMQRGNVDMNTVIQEAIHQITQDNPDRMIGWVIANLPIIFGDYALLRLVWINMLNNAVKFTRKKQQARIEIGFYREADEIVFFVRDNGVGFDMQYSQKLFGVFQRLHSLEDFEGTGVGLANVRQIISKHQGKTWAEAEIDKGATFYFTIPIQKEGPQC